MNTTKINTALLGVVVVVAGYVGDQVQDLTKIVAANTAIIERIEATLDRTSFSLQKRTDRYEFPEPNS